MSNDEFEARILLPLYVVGCIAIVLLIACGVMR